jgi:hypothetical protein
MDFFARTTFPTRDPFVAHQAATLGCPECQAIKKKYAAAAAANGIQNEEELSCSKCKRKKKKNAPMTSVEASQLPADIQLASMGQTAQSAPGAPGPASPVPAAPAPQKTSPWLIAAGILGVLGIGVWAANS